MPKICWEVFAHMPVLSFYGLESNAGITLDVEAGILVSRMTSKGSKDREVFAHRSKRTHEFSRLILARLSKISFSSATPCSAPTNFPTSGLLPHCSILFFTWAGTASEMRSRIFSLQSECQESYERQARCHSEKTYPTNWRTCSLASSFMLFLITLI